MNQCRYCGKTFVKESTLTSHVCEKKRRFQQEREIGVQWGYQAYTIFYQTTQSGRGKSYADFVDSSYYTAFVRFGRHCHAIHCINLAAYTKWLLKNNRRLDQWHHDNLYAEWLLNYIKTENIQDALERSMQTMIDYTEQHPEYRNGFRDYFSLVNENRICHHIITGRISPWILYSCEAGTDFLSRLNEDQVSGIIGIIEPEYWQSRLRDCQDDAIFAKQVLATAGL